MTRRKERIPELGGIKTQLDEHEGRLAAEQRRIHKALQKDGQTWMEWVKSPDFESLDKRGISVSLELEAEAHA